MFNKMKQKIATSIAQQLNKNSFGMSGLSKWFGTANLEDQGMFNIDDAYNSNAYVNIAVNKIAKNIVRAKSEIVNSKGDIVTSGPVYNLFRDVNNQMSRAQLWEATVSWLGIKGESIWVLGGKNEGSITGVPITIHVVDPKYFRQIFNKEKTDIILWMYEKNDIKIPFTVSEIIHFREWNAIDEWRGINPLRALSDEIESDRLIDKTNNTLMKNKSVPAGLLTTEESITEQQAKEILSMWNKNHGGHAKSGKTGVLGSGTKYQRIAMSAADMEFFVSKKWNRNVITGKYGVPAIVAGFKDDTTPLSGSDTNEQLKFFWEQTLIPIIRFLEDKLDTEFSKRFAPDQHIRFNTSDIPELQEDLALLATRVREDVKAGLLTQNEGRELMHLEKVSWGDTWWRDSKLIDSTEPIIIPPIKNSLSFFNNHIDKDIEEWNYIKHNKEFADNLLVELKDWLYKQRSVVLEQLSIEGGELNELFWTQQSSFLRNKMSVIIKNVKQQIIKNANLHIDKEYIDYKISNDNNYNIVRLSDKVRDWVSDSIEGGDIDETREKYKIASAKLSVIAEKEIDMLVDNIRDEINSIGKKKQMN